jgi:hypothetical protein
MGRRTDGRIISELHISWGCLGFRYGSKVIIMFEDYITIEYYILCFTLCTCLTPVTWQTRHPKVYDHEDDFFEIVPLRF